MKVTLVSIVIPVLLGPEGFHLWGQTRQEEGLLDGTWEFPGGKIEAGELPVEAAVRELAEEVGLKVGSESLVNFKTYPYSYPDRRVVLHAHLLPISSENKYLDGINKAGWRSFDFSRSEVSNIPEANKLIIAELTSYIARHQSDENWRKWWQQSSC